MFRGEEDDEFWVIESAGDPSRLKKKQLPKICLEAVRDPNFRKGPDFIDFATLFVLTIPLLPVFWCIMTKEK
jgi:hypothetical protein